jgi:hypothetical protein
VDGGADEQCDVCDEKNLRCEGPIRHNERGRLLWISI